MSQLDSRPKQVVSATTIGSPGSPTTISTSQLVSCYQSQYFTGASDNSVVFRVPGSPENSGCVTTPNSQHCRTELRSSRIWQPTSSVNRLTADLRVVNPGGSTAIGPVKIDDSVSTKPAIELYYGGDGTITVGVQRSRAGGGQVMTTLGRVPVGTRFRYEIRWEKGTMQVGVNGDMRVLSQNDLDNPPVYFKAGNYLQGSSPSEVRFYSLHVAHSAGEIGTPGTTLPPVPTTIVPILVPGCPQRDLGPYNLQAVLPCTGDPTWSTFIPIGIPPGSGDGGGTGGGGGGSCSDASAPAIGSEHSSTFKMFTDLSCCTGSFQTIKLGTLDTCHNAAGGNSVSSFWQANGQGMFGRGIRIYYYAEADCKGSVVDYSLTNQAGCQALGGGRAYRSFRIATSSGGGSGGGGGGGGSSPGSCTNSVTQPSSSNQNTVTLNLHSAGCCTDTAFETTTIGKFGVCHRSNKPFKGLTQRVGGNLFGKNLHVWAFTDHACGGGSPLVIDLSNDPECYTSRLQTFFSFAVVEGPRGNRPTFSSCSVSKPAIKNDNTVTLKLFSDDCCTPTQTISLGSLVKCHTPSGGSFSGLTQAVGENMFGRNIKIWAYPDSTSCSGDKRVGISLSNSNDQCFWLGNAAGRVAFRSFKIDTGNLGSGSAGCHGNGQGPDPGSDDDSHHGNDQGQMPGCDAGPTPYSEGTVQLSLYSDHSCCDTFQRTHIGNLNSCHNTKDGRPIASLAQAPGRGLFGQNIHLWVFDQLNCQGNYQGLSLTNNGGCQVQGRSWKSYMISQTSLSSGPFGTGGGSSGSTGGGVGGRGGGGSGGGGSVPCPLPDPADVQNDMIFVAYYSGSDQCDDMCRALGASIMTSVSAVLSKTQLPVGTQCNKTPAGTRSLGFAAGPNLHGQPYGIQVFEDDNCGETNNGMLPIQPITSDPHCMSAGGSGLIRSWRAVKTSSTLDIGPGIQPDDPGSHHQVWFDGAEPCAGAALNSDTWFKTPCDNDLGHPAEIWWDWERWDRAWSKVMVPGIRVEGCQGGDAGNLRIRGGYRGESEWTCELQTIGPDGTPNLNDPCTSGAYARKWMCRGVCWDCDVIPFEFRS